jgi:hypothetical protein
MKRSLHNYAFGIWDPGFVNLTSEMSKKLGDWKLLINSKDSKYPS